MAIKPLPELWKRTVVSTRVVVSRWSEWHTSPAVWAAFWKSWLYTGSCAELVLACGDIIQLARPGKIFESESAKMWRNAGKGGRRPQEESD